MLRWFSFALALCCMVAATRAEKVVLVAGGGDGADGSRAVAAKVPQPFGIVRDSAGRLVLVEYSGRVRAIGADGVITTLCGNGAKGDSGDGGPAKDAQLNAPHALAIGSDKAIYIADTLNHKVRRIDAQTGIITTVAGSSKGFGGDGGPAEKAQFNGIYCISFNPGKDKLVITDLENKRIRVMDMKSRVVTSVAGNGQKGVPADGADAATSPLVDPRAAAMDSKGNVYILERSGHALRVVDARGKIRTLIAGPDKPKSPSAIRGPKHLIVDSHDDLIITDTDHHKIVKWLVGQQKLVPVAGIGKVGKAGLDGPPDQVQLNQPHGVFLDAENTLYITDTLNDRVLKISR